MAAFQGADAIFSNTDFWTQFFNPTTREKLKPGQTINEYCYDVEVQQGKNVADAAATVGSLDRFILSALCNAKKLSKGKYTQVYHFDSKANIVEYVREKHPDLAAKMSVVQVGVYMSGWRMMCKPTKVPRLNIISFPLPLDPNLHTARRRILPILQHQLRQNATPADRQQQRHRLRSPCCTRVAAR